MLRKRFKVAFLAALLILAPCQARMAAREACRRSAGSRATAAHRVPWDRHAAGDQGGRSQGLCPSRARGSDGRERQAPSCGGWSARASPIPMCSAPCISRTIASRRFSDKVRSALEQSRAVVLEAADLSADATAHALAAATKATTYTDGRSLENMLTADEYEKVARNAATAPACPPRRRASTGRGSSPC